MNTYNNNIDSPVGLNFRFQQKQLGSNSLADSYIRLNFTYQWWEYFNSDMWLVITLNYNLDYFYPRHQFWLAIRIFRFWLNSVGNSNTPAYSYPHQGLVIIIQLDKCWLWSDWLDWLLDLFLISRLSFEISQSYHNWFITSVWVFNNSFSDIIIQG